MAEYTPTGNLIKPGASEFYDIQNFNNNMDKIDETMGDVQVLEKKIRTGRRN